MQHFTESHRRRLVMSTTANHIFPAWIASAGVSALRSVRWVWMPATLLLTYARALWNATFMESLDTAALRTARAICARKTLYMMRNLTVIFVRRTSRLSTAQPTVRASRSYVMCQAMAVQVDMLLRKKLRNIKRPVRRSIVDDDGLSVRMFR